MTTNNTRDLVRRAHRLFNNPMVPPSTNKHNRRAWVRSVRLLGSNWLLATPIERTAPTPSRFN